MGWPFQEGFVVKDGDEIRVFTDYRWDTGARSRLWHVPREDHDFSEVIVRPIDLTTDMQDD